MSRVEKKCAKCGHVRKVGAVKMICGWGRCDGILVRTDQDTSVCPTCKRPFKPKPARICGLCKRPILSGHKWHIINGSTIAHRVCEDPKAYHKGS